ncbi:hypothetical protein RBB79_19430 [Tunturiibacter empetritectus]|uniref:Uncharacterized protein n=2 Tax=Tunturiibacter TaxID=3154218 RepID=A0A852VG95_9BACT|nr:hypothetical protein [Edaphobacter lichenicola]NYF91843.1 hypothetical protein [Edaphobacter lichenicola]
MVSNVARLTSALRSSVFEEDEADLSPSPETALTEKIDAVRRDLAETGVALFTDDRGHRFRLVRKPA